jgi:AcrR family transcriptional regulator
MKRKAIREMLLSTAAKLFYKQGYSNTGINQIVEEAGVAKSSLYQHFNTKEDLLLAYLEETGAQTMAALQDAASKHKQPKVQVVAIFDYLEELVKQPELYGCRFLNIVYEMPCNNDHLRVKIKAQKDSVRALFSQILLPINKESLADELYTLFEGALIGNKIHQDVWPIMAARNTVQKLL